MKEQVVLACECGATVKCSVPVTDTRTVKLVRAAWWQEHNMHQAVSCAEARDIREDIKRRNSGS